MNDAPLTIRRKPLAMLVSGLLHAALALLLLRLTFQELQPMVEFQAASLVFAPAIAPAPDTPRPRVIPKPLTLPAPFALQPLLAMEPSPRAAAFELTVPPVQPPNLEAPLPVPPQPAPRATGFESAAAHLTQPVLKPSPRLGSFGDPIGGATPIAATPLSLRVGSFEGGSASVEHAPAPRGDVSLAGFDSPVGFDSPARVAAGGSKSTRLESRFGSVEAAAARPALKPAVARTQFEAVTITAAATPKPRFPSGGSTTALEILQKPVPVYTSAARSRRLEGEVLLEAMFSATGQVRVLRVLRGLGYGLDENAIQAAANIRFRPATERGQPVDTVAMVRIDFQLAY